MDNLDDLTINDLLKKYFETKRVFAANAAKYKKYETKQKKLIEDIKNALASELNRVGVKSMSTPNGRFFKKKKDYVQISNWSDTLQFILNEDLLHFFNKSVSKAAVKEFMQENEGEVPPGIRYIQEDDIGVTK